MRIELKLSLKLLSIFFLLNRNSVFSDFHQDPSFLLTSAFAFALLFSLSSFSSGGKCHPERSLPPPTNPQFPGISAVIALSGKISQFQFQF
jgi:hypothetical protein